MAFDFPSSPTTGQTYSVTGGPTYVYNGTAWVVLTPGNQFNRTVFTATAGQTTFTMNYVVGAIDVYRNGVKLVNTSDFTATNGTSIVLLNAATAGDTIEVISYPMITYSDAVKRTGDTMTGALTVPMVVTDSPLQFRNKLINGGFDVWQRGTSFSATTPVFTADRWFVTHAGSALTASYTRQDAVGVWGQARYYIRLARTAGSGMTVHSFTQRIEGVETLQNGTATFSFDCRDLTGAQTIGIRLVQSFGSGGSADVTIASQSVSVPSGSTPQRRSVTFDIPSIAGKTIGTSDYLALIIDLPLGGNFQIDIANAQLEAGSIATPFERRAFGVEEMLCHRYYQKLSSTAVVNYGSGNEIAGIVSLYCPMRTNPTMSIVPGASLHKSGIAFYSLTTINSSGVGADGIGYFAIGISGSPGGGTVGQVMGGLIFTAEL